MPSTQPTRTRIVAAWIAVILTVVAVWLLVDYRTQPPPPPPSSVAAPL